MNIQSTLLISVFTLTIVCLPGTAATPVNNTGTVSLNGEWETGYSRKYNRTVTVPGISNDPSVIRDEVLWYRKEIALPEGSWKSATLELKGARFRPVVYINGEEAGNREGGMAPLFFRLSSKAVKPGKKIVLEIALASLKDVPAEDASYIPVTDQWRSDISSGLWDDVVLHLHGEARIERIIPFFHAPDKTADIRFDLDAPSEFTGEALLEILNPDGSIVASHRQAVSGLNQYISSGVMDSIRLWSPGDPNLYTLQLSLFDKRHRLSDRQSISLGLKSLEIRDKHFFLNGKPFFARGVTVVWHRWMRTQEGRELGYDTAWFHTNILQRTKDLGGNYLRFHLGLPPERFLDLCDRYGMAVQFEWSFFHGMPASEESLLRQYKNWLDLAMRHPCVSFVHPYNETEGEQLKTAWSALDLLLMDYPPLLLEDRDVLHIHKYWWSLFENLGLYYDDASVFPKAIMVDEFGGNYLDGNGDPGGYSTVRETFLRFLGRSHTREERLAFHSQANARVAEYWRRIGAAGISPFCALGSDQDGNHWFLGPLKKGNPKPVWEALAPAFSSRSVSLEIWDRDFIPGETINLPLYLFNDEDNNNLLQIRVTIEDKSGEISWQKNVDRMLKAWSREIEHLDVTMPASTGDYTLKAEILNPPAELRYPVVSAWDFRVYKATLPANLEGVKIAIPASEKELRTFLGNQNITAVALNDPEADIILTSVDTWKALERGDKALSGFLRDAIMRGISVVMLDAGDRQLGQGYPEKPGDLGPLQGVANVRDPKVTTCELFGGITLKFTETAEPESHLHPDRANRELWNGLPDEYTRLWNGYRGGLIVPAADMEFSGLSEDAFLAQWISRGADPGGIKSGPYYAFELQGFYGFSDSPTDKEVQNRLKEKVSFLVQDAPALASVINPRAPLSVTDLNLGYSETRQGIARDYVPLASCGKNLTRTPVAMVRFGPGKGKLIISQILTSGRLDPASGGEGLYSVRYDEVTAQFVLNMISLSVRDN